jgi:hypothetical protein
MKDEESFWGIRIENESSFANSPERHYNRHTFDSELMDRETQPILMCGSGAP